MSKFSDMTNKELANCIFEWTGDAANSWDSFKDSEKNFFRQLQDEACKRFIDEHIEVAADDIQQQD